MKEYLTMTIPIWVALLALGVGSGATLGLQALIKGGDASAAAEATADAVEAATAPEVEQEATDRQAIEAETQAEVCKDGPHYDAQACVMVDLCQMQAAEGSQMAKVCDVVVNLWVSGEVWDKCSGIEYEIDRSQCFALHGARK